MFNFLLTDTVTVEPFATEAASGWNEEGSFGTPVAYPCRVVWQQKKISAANGEMRLSQGQVVLLGVQAIDVRDRLTLPEYAAPHRQPKILSIQRTQDPFNIVSNTTLFF